jgi:hypothetical protein
MDRSNPAPRGHEIPQSMWRANFSASALMFAEFSNRTGSSLKGPSWMNISTKADSQVYEEDIPLHGGIVQR